VDADDSKEHKVPLQVKLSPRVARFVRLKSKDEMRQISEIVETAIVRSYLGESVSSADLRLPFAS
jgi:hypothetical protein